jgi:hypothetical protein
MPLRRTAELLEFPAHLTQTIEQHYFGALHRLDQQRNAQNADPDYSTTQPSTTPNPIRRSDFNLRWKLPRTRRPNTPHSNLKSASSSAMPYFFWYW